MVNFDTFLLTHRRVNLNAHANTNRIICFLIVDEMETQYASPKWFQDSIFNNSRAIPISKKNLSKTKQITTKIRQERLSDFTCNQITLIKRNKILVYFKLP